MKPCQSPTNHDLLAAYWLGELPEEEEHKLEEHVFQCAYCSTRLEALARQAAGIKAAVQASAITLAITPQFLEHLKREGLRFREYRAQPGETVHCAIGAEDDAVVSRLQAKLVGVKRVDAVKSTEVGGRTERWRVQDVPFDEAAGEVLLTPPTPALRRMPDYTWRVQLLAVEEGRDRLLGEYTFAHTAG